MAHKTLSMIFFNLIYQPNKCLITYKIFMATFWAFKIDTTIRVTPTPYSGIMNFCDKILFCLEPSKEQCVSQIYQLRLTDHYQNISLIILTTYHFVHLHF